MIVSLDRMSTYSKNTLPTAKSDPFFIVAGLAANPEKAVDGFILRPLRFERYSLVKDVVLQATSS
jgi:hypothetical protein